MSNSILSQIRQAIEQLNPHEVREHAEIDVWVRLNATSEESYRRMEGFFSSSDASPEKRREILKSVYRRQHDGPATPHIDVYEMDLERPEGSFVFNPRRPVELMDDILAERQEFGLPIARLFPHFRKQVTDQVIFNVARENATFALMSALPDLAPGMQIPWALPEMVSDTSVLTVNQIRMAFLIGAAHDRPVGYREQKGEIAAIIAGAFGWRAVARELISKIPFGGGILPKAGIAFAATYVEGLSLERLYRVGSGLSRVERKLAYGEALTRGKDVASAILDSLRKKKR
jgi:hypothetical protein